MSAYIGIYKTDYHNFLIKKNPRSAIPELRKQWYDKTIVVYHINTQSGIEFFNRGKNTIYSLNTAEFMYDFNNDNIIKNRYGEIPTILSQFIKINKSIKKDLELTSFSNMKIAETLYIGGHKHHELIDKLQDELTFVEQVIYGMEIDNIDINIIKSKFPEYVI